ncbi:MAG: hypothetical protein K6E85_14600 [Lachnospiraceae bacterium]|nr:hypothetical protein [Lachnospiraceae bacterium]
MGCITKLRELSSDMKAAQFAVGAFFDDDGHDIKNALRTADTEMYNDKALFYKNHPEPSRRN